ncbi:SIR2 family protein [Prevotella intermedia]|uniref:SIR2 family protein n=1 Tax=Prevotella intermedia TaxID=28131 RepID=A0A2D3L7W2_PREIN|nr:SIR2 family protein [Prevotella intermedia]ATV26520.1 SIR2 family protein [Prevotella intermedia]
MINIPPGLKEAIEADDLVLFIGAGLSWDLKNTDNESLEGWDKMVKSITSHLNEKGHIKDELKQSCDALKSIETLEILENREISKKEVGEFIKHYFALGKENDFSFHKKLFSLSTKIITTNYDRAFEEAVPELQSKKAYRTKDYELNRLKKDPIFLFKLHGCIDHLDSIVLFPSDYNELYDGEGREAEHALYALRNLIFNKTFLFIGTSLGDPQVKGILEEIKRIQGLYGQKHYIIVSKPLENPLNSLAPIQVTSYTEVPEVIDQLLEIKQAAEEKKSFQEKMLSDQLKESEKEIISLTEELDKEKNKNKRQSLLLEREAKNHFNIGLKHHLAGEYLDASKEYKVATELNPEHCVIYSNWGVALSDLAQTKPGIEAEALYNESFEKYQKATQIKPNDHETYNNWGVALSDLAQTKSGIEAEALYNAAFEKYQQAIQITPDFYEAYYNWGGALSNLAQTKSGIEAEELYNAAFEKYHQATLSKPDFHKAYYNWGVVLTVLAQTKSGIEAEELYNTAFEKYQQATQIKPDFYETYNNWGVALSDLAQTKSSIEAEELYNAAFEKYQQATQIKPDFHEAYNNWGVALSRIVQTKFGIEAEELYNAAFEKYQQATQIKPDFHEAYNNWGVALSNLAQTKFGIEAEKLYNEAFEKYQQAIKNGGKFYYLACLYTIRNKKEEALKYLERSLSRNEVSVEFVEKDKDWDGLRDDSDFKRILSNMKG